MQDTVRETRSLVSYSDLPDVPRKKRRRSKAPTKAVQVASSTKATAAPTKASINFEIAYIPPTTSTASNTNSKTLCKFYRSGSCSRGDLCQYSHNLKLAACVFYHWKGHCAAGQKCRFSHEPMTLEQNQQLLKELEQYRTNIQKTRQSLVAEPGPENILSFHEWLLTRTKVQTTT